MQLFRLYQTLWTLEKIDYLLNQLNHIDPYGDILENFAEYPDKYPPVTKRLIKMVKADIKRQQKMR